MILMKWSTVERAPKKSDFLEDGVENGFIDMPGNLYQRKHTTAPIAVMPGDVFTGKVIPLRCYKPPVKPYTVKTVGFAVNRWRRKADVIQTQKRPGRASAAETYDSFAGADRGASKQTRGKAGYKRLCR
ncbi:hypothetical protein [Vibrio cortegadensis]|uniref:hypothetical protein n=1 Tax=Vibrio cortegadensis TaxID=1328770 RepID=UPI0021C26121|nr:hypothetical protein [Vibrio cortegadensis]